MVSAEELYQAYGESTGFKNFRGDPMPLWGDLPEMQRAAWDAVADAAAPTVDLDDREMEQIRHAVDYEEHYKAAGVPGHGQILLISKLAQALGLASPTKFPYSVIALRSPEENMTVLEVIHEGDDLSHLDGAYASDEIGFMSREHAENHRDKLAVMFPNVGVS